MLTDAQTLAYQQAKAARWLVNVNDLHDHDLDDLGDEAPRMLVVFKEADAPGGWENNGWFLVLPDGKWRFFNRETFDVLDRRVHEYRDELRGASIADDDDVKSGVARKVEDYRHSLHLKLPAFDTFEAAQTAGKFLRETVVL